jgi:ferritin
MLKKKIEKGFNDQIDAENYSAYLYLAMAAYFEKTDLPGFANWLKCQVQEELSHAMRFYNFINDRSGTIKLGALEAPPVKWKSPLDAFKAALKHEVYITDRINKLVDLARLEKDHAADNFLQWFVAEQVEEEAQTDEVVQQLKLVGGNGYGLLMLDREMGARTFVVPTNLSTLNPGE